MQTAARRVVPAAPARHPRRGTRRARCGGGSAVRALWRKPPVRSLVGLVSVLVLYFAAPVEQQSSAARLAANILLTTVCLVVVAMVVVREFRRMQLGEDLRFTGGQLLIGLEVVLVTFALTYFSLAIHGQDQMVGIRTRVD